MKQESHRPTLSARKKQGIRFSVCVLLAAVIWLVNALNKNYHTVVSVPVYHARPLENNAAYQVPSSIRMDVSGRGFALIRFKNAASDYAVRTTALRPGNRDSVLDSRMVLASLLDPFNNDISVDYINPPRLFLSGRTSFSKRLKVAGRPVLDLAANTVQAGPHVFYPDSVTVFSGSPIPEHLKLLNALLPVTKNIRQSVFQKVQLQLPEGIYQAVPKEVWCYVPLEAGTEIQLDVPVLSRNGATDELFVPARVTITCKVPLSKYSETKSDRFIVQPTPPAIGGEKVALEIKHAPYWVSDLRLYPEMVSRLKKPTF